MRLAYQAGETAVPVVGVLVKGSKAGARERVVYRTLYATNPTRLTKGDQIVLAESPPSTLESTE